MATTKEVDPTVILGTPDVLPSTGMVTTIVGGEVSEKVEPLGGVMVTPAGIVIAAVSVFVPTVADAGAIMDTFVEIDPAGAPGGAASTDVAGMTVELLTPVGDEVLSSPQPATIIIPANKPAAPNFLKNLFIVKSSLWNFALLK